MDNFYSWMMKPLSKEDVTTWFDINNMIFEKRELFADFTRTLYFYVSTTYLGDDHIEKNETKIQLSEEEKQSHFNWCWNKTLDTFNKEKIHFNKNGEHREYFNKFFMDLFYNIENPEVANNIPKFFNELFNDKKAFTKSDLDMITDLYKKLNKNLK